KVSSLSVLQLDAHADMRDSYMGSPYNHACVMRRIAELTSFVQLGLRSFSKEEAEFMKKKNFPFQTSNQIITEDKWKKIVEDNLSEKVYLTIDVDVLDPSIMPSVGTPEPGGIDWWKILEILKYVAGCKKIVGVDVVEFCPLPGIVAPDFLVARLIYKTIGYIIYKNDLQRFSGPNKKR
ncbi:arginase family protein, partial [Candidatus Aerophobetes bacterium]|nr:arginase family protein [Candidatus Aerophobetes bacterium]